MTPVGGLFYFDRLDLTDELSFEIPDMKDISFAILPNSFAFPFLTHELKCGDDIIVHSGKEKKIINSDCISTLSKDDYCLIEGCVRWNDSGIRLDRVNVIYCDLRLESIDNEGYYILKAPYPICYQEWAGLSGGPVFNDKNRLIGMAIRVSETDNTLTVIPMSKITELMDIAIRNEEHSV